MGKGQTSKGRTSATTSETDNAILKEKNLELAKALSELQMLYNHTAEDRNYMRQELFVAKLHIKKLENYLDTVDRLARESINCIVALTNHSTEIVNAVTLSRRLTNRPTFGTVNQSANKSESCSLNKTQAAVKPMIDGHVIYSPTINLRRVTENSVSPRQHRASDNLQSIENDYNGDADQSNGELSVDDLFERRPSTNRQTYRHNMEHEPHEEMNSSEGSVNDVQLSINNMRLSTIVEDEMENNLDLAHRRNSSNDRSRVRSGGAGPVPLLSGVFRDVRVYLSPVDPHPYVTTTRGSTNRNALRASNAQLRRSVAAESSAENNDVSSDVQDYTMEPNSSNFLKHTSSTPITSFIYNHSSSTLNVANSSLDNSDPKRRVSKRRHTNPKKLFFNGSSLHNISNIANVTDDPLEGPSNLLDNYDIDKIHTLSQLGLAPTPSSTAYSGSDTPKSPETEEFSTATIENTSKRKTKPFITNRKVVSSKIKSVSFTSDSERKSSEKENKASEKVKKSKKGFLKRKKKKANSPQSEEATLINSSHSTPVAKSPNVKVERNSRRAALRVNVQEPPLQSPVGKSPKAERRPKRAASKVNLKEPPLNKKMRRSK